MKTSKVWKKDEFKIRLAKNSDAESYYKENFCPLDKEIVRLTGCKEVFTKDEVISFFHSSIENENYYLFLIFSPEGRIIGETVINDINFDLASANFRIAIFDSTLRGKGLGTFAVAMTRDFAFSDLKLEKLTLEVYPFNLRAKKCYLRAGFQPENFSADRFLEQNEGDDTLVMSISSKEWQKMKSFSK